MAFSPGWLGVLGQIPRGYSDEQTAEQGRELQRQKALELAQQMATTNRQAPLQDALLRAQATHLNRPPQAMTDTANAAAGNDLLMRFAMSSGAATPMPMVPGAPGGPASMPPGGPASMPPGGPVPMPPGGPASMPPGGPVPMPPGGPAPIAGASPMPSSAAPSTGPIDPATQRFLMWLQAQPGSPVAKQQAFAEFINLQQQQNQAAHTRALEQAQMANLGFKREAEAGKGERLDRRLKSTEDIASAGRESRESMAADKLATMPDVERQKGFQAELSAYSRNPGMTPDALAAKSDELMNKWGLTPMHKALRTMSPEDKAQLKAIGDDIFKSAGSTKRSTYMGLGTPESVPNAVDKTVNVGGRQFRIYRDSSGDHVEPVE